MLFVETVADVAGFHGPVNTGVPLEYTIRSKQNIKT